MSITIGRRKIFHSVKSLHFPIFQKLANNEGLIFPIIKQPKRNYFSTVSKCQIASNDDQSRELQELHAIMEFCNSKLTNYSQSYPKKMFNYMKLFESLSKVNLPLNLLKEVVLEDKMKISALDEIVLQFDKFGNEKIQELKILKLKLILNRNFLVMMMIKSMYQNIYSIEEWKIVFPSGNDHELVQLEKDSYLWKVYQSLLDDLLENKQEFTRETLICLTDYIYKQFVKGSDKQKIRISLEIFIEQYPRVKQAYLSNDKVMETEWTHALGTALSDSEFYWYRDLETQNEIHLEGMFNIFKIVLLNLDELGMVDEKSYLGIFKFESERAPSNHIIHFLRQVLCGNMN